MRLLIPLALLLVACGRGPDREELYGLWGRIDAGRYDILELAPTLDATGLTEVRPAYRRYRYPTNEVPLAVEGGRWIVLNRELIFNAAWATDDTPTNKNRVYELVDWDPLQLLLLPPDAEEPLFYTTLSRLPTTAID
jgi:hypothetical protein